MSCRSLLGVLLEARALACSQPRPSGKARALVCRALALMRCSARRTLDASGPCCLAVVSIGSTIGV